jgi:prophage antirepressor-like protein
MSISELLDKVYDNIYKFNGSDILLLFDKNNTIWLSYNDVLNSIGYKYNIIQKKRLNMDEKYFNTYENLYPQSKLNKINLKNQQPIEKMINEAGIYELLRKSQKPLAEQLSKTLFTEVLPELRKKGKYVLNTTERKNMSKLTRKIKLYQKELKRTTKQSYLDKTGNGFIYILKVKTIHNGVEKKCHKIGYTANLEKRLATYKTGNPDVELVHSENLHCNKKQLETCVMNLNILKLLKNKSEVICDIPLKKILEEIEDCKALLDKHKSS